MDGAIVVSQVGGPEVLQWSRQDPGEPGSGEVLVATPRSGSTSSTCITVLASILWSFRSRRESKGRVSSRGSGPTSTTSGWVTAWPTPATALWARTAKAGFSALATLRGAGQHRRRYSRGYYAEGLHRRVSDPSHVPREVGGLGPAPRSGGGRRSAASQWLKVLGAHVIGTVGSEEKAELAEGNGCEHTILYRDEDVPARVKEITQGRGVDVAYDSVGAADLSWFAGLAPAPRHDGDLRQCLRTGGADLAAVTRPEGSNLPHQADGRALLRHPGRRGRGCGRPLRCRGLWEGAPT